LGCHYEYNGRQIYNNLNKDKVPAFKEELTRPKHYGQLSYIKL